MLDKTKFMALHYYDYGVPFTGSYNGMRFSLEKKNAEEEACLEVTIWPGPLNAAYTPEEKKQRMTFPFSEEGKDMAVEWLEEQRAVQKELFDHVPALLDAYS